MKKSSLFIIIPFLLVSCFDSRSEDLRPEREKNLPFEKIKKFGKSIKSDTVFYNHVGDITIPLNKSMAALKTRFPDFYEECMSCSTDKELTAKLKSSRKFRKIAKEKGLDLTKVLLIKIPK